MQVFGSSTTQLLRNLSFALSFSPGDEIIVSSIDHESNIAPWIDLAARQDLVLKWWTPPQSTSPKLAADDSLRVLLGPRTRLVTCTHVSNILGTITDVRAVADLVHAASPGALLAVDGTAYAPHRPIDIAALGADIYAFSWYKVYGPHIAMLYVSRAAGADRGGPLRSLGLYFRGSVTLEEKLGFAGASYELMQAIPAVVEYLQGNSGGGGSSGDDDGDGGAPSSTWEVIAGHERQLQGTLLDYLNSKPETFTVFGETSSDPAVRVPTVSFTVKGRSSRDVVQDVEQVTNFAFRFGAFYSNRLVHELLDLDSNGVVRVSMVHYNTVEEVKGLIDAIDKVTIIDKTSS
ncbi:pyridoxal phosphate-dependent transferase [Xylariales sp. PMI_506]|nr:pyridoxal phosphate-dependent transferase [Xylariales sp. PMI_506]